MGALEGLDLSEEGVDADVGQVEHLVGDGLVRREAGVAPSPLEDGRQHDINLNGVDNSSLMKFRSISFSISPWIQK